MLVFRKKWMLTLFVNPEMYLLGKNVFVRSTGRAGEEVRKSNAKKLWKKIEVIWEILLHKIRETPVTLGV